MDWEEKNDFGEMGFNYKGSLIKKVADGCIIQSVESSSSSSIGTFSCSLSSLSSSHEDLEDDASSSSNSSSNSRGPLYELDDLMAQLPIKRGLSKYYNGKSQTFTSLAHVKSVEDLAKKNEHSSYSRRMKSCKSFGGSLSLKQQQHHHKLLGPKATINKEACKRSSLSPNSMGVNNKLWIL